ncbi:MAG: hypothetical protein AAGA48_21670 [Myxococcota bacterium]
MRTETHQTAPRTDAHAVVPDFFDGADRTRALRAPRRAEVSKTVACAMDVPHVVIDRVCGELSWNEQACSEGYVSLSNPFGTWVTDMSPAPRRQAPMRVAPPTSMVGMVAAIHHVLHGRIDPMARVEHRDLWQAYARALVERADPLGNVVAHAVLGDPIAEWFKGIDGAQQLGGLMRLGTWVDARWDRGLRIDLDGTQPNWTGLERVTTEFAFLRVFVHDLQPSLLHIVGETPRMQSLTFTNQNLDSLDLGWLERFGPLTALDVEGFALRHLDPVRSHQRMEQLRVAQCRGLLDLSMLRGMKELIDLHLAGCPTAVSWDALPTLPALRRLTVGSQGEWTTVEGIRDCAQVTEMELYDLETVDDLRPVSTLTSTTSLTLRNVGMSDLRSLVELPQLTSLSLIRNHQLMDFRALAECSALEHLTLERLMWLRDLSAVARLRHLTELTIVKCRRLTELASFSIDSKLESFTLVGCPAVEDLHGIAMCQRLKVIRLAQTSIASIKDFVGLPNLEAVVLLDPPRDPKLREALRRARAVEKPAEDLAPDHPNALAYILPETPEDA